MKYDFAGWVTKNDIKCADGVTIRHGAFKGNDGGKVPLVWNHDYNSPENVLGHIILKHKDEGVYGYGFFNDTPSAQSAKSMLAHGDVDSMSIGARKIKRNANDVVHGSIYEVSLVLSGANPGAVIETVMTHSEDGTEDAFITTGLTNMLHHSGTIPPEELKHNDDPEDDGGSGDKTIEAIIETMNEEQKNAVYALVGMIAEDQNDGGDDEMKQNVFNQNGGTNEQNEVLKHGIMEALQHAKQNKTSFKHALSQLELTNDAGDVLQHGINSIEMLFPETQQSTNGNVPLIYKDNRTNFLKIINGVHKSPFQRLKTTIFDLSEEEARAKGYIKGNFKKEEFFSIIKRTVDPTMIYKKQKLDREDILDIEDFDIVAFMNSEMDMMLKEEIARAILVGDGRSIDDEDKIREDKLRPIISDNEFFTIKAKFPAVADFIEAVIIAMAEYEGSGTPDLYIDPVLLSQIKLVKDENGRYLLGDIPSTEKLAALLGVDEIVPTTFLKGKGAIIVNLADYSLGSVKGGQVTSFDDFDIDYNQYKYLKETRLCGMLTAPKTAIYLKPGHSVGAGASNTDAGLTFGKRQADKNPTQTPGDGE